MNTVTEQIRPKKELPNGVIIHSPYPSELRGTGDHAGIWLEPPSLKKEQAETGISEITETIDILLRPTQDEIPTEAKENLILQQIAPEQFAKASANALAYTTNFNHSPSPDINQIREGVERFFEIFNDLDEALLRSTIYYALEATQDNTRSIVAMIQRMDIGVKIDPAIQYFGEKPGNLAEVRYYKMGDIVEPWILIGNITEEKLPLELIHELGYHVCMQQAMAQKNIYDPLKQGLKLEWGWSNTKVPDADFYPRIGRARDITKAYRAFQDKFEIVDVLPHRILDILMDIAYRSEGARGVIQTLLFPKIET